MILVLKLPNLNALNAQAATISTKIRQLVQHVQSQIVVSAIPSQHRYAMSVNQHIMGMGQVLAHYVLLRIVMSVIKTLHPVTNALKDI